VGEAADAKTGRLELPQGVPYLQMKIFLELVAEWDVKVGIL
jgi:hypothetical protein